MELCLAFQSEILVTVSCDEQISHSFEIDSLIPDKSISGRPPHPLEDPVTYGHFIFEALFAAESLARRTLNSNPDRIILTATDEVLHTIPWEYSHNGDDFIVLEVPFVRGLAKSMQTPKPDIGNTPPYIVAIASNPLGEDIIPLNIAAEWQNLCEIVDKIPQHITLERANPPTLDSLREKVAYHQNMVVHFMGHGGQHEGRTVLFFEKEYGGIDPVSAKDLLLTVKDQVFMVIMNACASAMPGETDFNDLAASLVKSKIPYALGMRFSIPDKDALAFSRAFYTEIAAGIPVEVAIFHARRSMLRNSTNPWVVGVPILYTSLSEAAPGFATTPGKPLILSGQPPMDVIAIPRAEEAFQGRVPELLALGKALTGDQRTRLLTIHGGGGQGKTALAREAVERFAHAWPGGVWAISLESLPSHLEFITRLANFLNLPSDDLPEQAELERRLLNALGQRRTLLVLDNAETLVEAVDKKEQSDLDLVSFLREQLSGTLAGLLVTSRYRLGWTGEQALELGGLTPQEGARLFMQSSPIRQVDIPLAAAEALSERIGGHPLALRLLGSAFDDVQLSLEEFIEEYEKHLVEARDKYKGESHRHHSLFASIQTSVALLEEGLKALLSGLWVFEAPFLPESAAEIFAPLALGAPSPEAKEKEIEVREKQVINQLQTLHSRGLLAGERRSYRDGTLLVYRLLPTMRPYARQMAQAYPADELLTRFGAAYAQLAWVLSQALDRGGALVWLADHARLDFSRGIQHTQGEKQAWYQNHWGRALGRLGDRPSALSMFEAALEAAQGKYPQLELHLLNNMAGIYRAIGQPDKALKFFEKALQYSTKLRDSIWEATTLNNMALVYSDTGQPGKALELYQQAMPIMRESGDRAGEGATLNNMALVYRATGQPGKALELYEQALAINRSIGDRAGEAATLNNMALLYMDIGQPRRALTLLEQSLPITREVGDRAGEAATLNSIAEVYRNTGQPGRALEVFEQVISIAREVGELAGEAATLNNMALVYSDNGQQERALVLFMQVLPILKEVGDRAGEATTLNNMAGVYSDTGRPGKALELYEQALSIRREVGDRAGGAATLNNLAVVYCDTGYPEEALKIYNQVLPIMREVCNRAGEAATLNNMGMVYQSTGQGKQALELYNQALPIMREVDNLAGEASTLNNMAGVYSDIGKTEIALALYEDALILISKLGNRELEAATLNNMAEVYYDTLQLGKAIELYEKVMSIVRELIDKTREAVTCSNMAMVYRDQGASEKALEYLRQAVALKQRLQHPEYKQHAAMLEQWERALERGEPIPSGSNESKGISNQQLSTIVGNTIAVMTGMPEKRAEWLEKLVAALHQAQEGEKTHEIDFFTALLSVLDERVPSISADNPYAKALSAIQARILDRE